MPRVPESLRGLEVDLVFPDAPGDHQLRFAEKLAHLEHLEHLVDATNTSTATRCAAWPFGPSLPARAVLQERVNLGWLKASDFSKKDLRPDASFCPAAHPFRDPLDGSVMP